MEKIPHSKQEEDVIHYFLLTKLMYEYLAEQAEQYRMTFKERKPVAINELHRNHARTTRLLGKLAYRYERWKEKHTPADPSESSEQTE